MPGAVTAKHSLQSEPPILTSTARENAHYSAVILAGGEGLRLSSFTQKLYGYHVPKQFCPLFGGKTLLEQTMRRVSLVVPRSQTITVLNRAHKRFYSQLLNATEYRNLLVQPENRGTAPAILCALLRLIETGHPEPVAIFPSDHFVSDDFTFMRHVSMALRAVETVSQLTVLLGIAPDSPEAEYGWIEPGAPVEIPLSGLGQISRIRRFLEKPSPALACKLYDSRHLWNSFVLVGNPTTLLSLIARAVPELYDAFEGVRPFFGGAVEEEILGTVFRGLRSVDFSGRVLAQFATEFSVMPVSGVAWSDLGDPKRLVAAISSSGNRSLGGNPIVPEQPFPLTASPEQTVRSKALQVHR
jgi:mannose-1-phosphate guanylyltransferase